jgi:hypothetical protein
MTNTNIVNQAAEMSGEELAAVVGGVALMTRAFPQDPIQPGDPWAPPDPIFPIFRRFLM